MALKYSNKPGQYAKMLHVARESLKLASRRYGNDHWISNIHEPWSMPPHPYTPLSVCIPVCIHFDEVIALTFVYLSGCIASTFSLWPTEDCSNSDRYGPMNGYESTANYIIWGIYYIWSINPHETARYGEIASAILNFFVCCMEMG